MKAKRSVLDVVIGAVAFVLVAAVARLRGQKPTQRQAVALVEHVEQRQDAQRGEVAQVLDHPAPLNATTSQVAFIHDEEGSPTRPRLLVGPVIDGGTSWVLMAPNGGWRGLVRDLRTRAKKGARVVELAGVGGQGIVEVELEQTKGALVLWTSGARIEIAGKRCEAQIEARAAWTEGPARWCSRVLPLVSWWLLGVEQGDEPGSGWAWSRSIGWRQARVEIAMDFVGWPFTADDHKAIVTKMLVQPVTQGGHCRAIEFGRRSGSGSSGNPVSGAIYDKGAALAVLRGDPPAGYVERLRAAGWDGEEALTRLELRVQGKALHLVDGSTGEVHDFTDPSTAASGEAIGKLATHALGSVWLADLRRGRAAQVRDNPVHPGWLAARAAASGGCEPVKLTRAVVQAEHKSVVEHARGRLLRAGIDVGVLEGAETAAEAGELALEVLAHQLGTAEARERLGASRARYRELLDAVREVE